MYWLQGYFEVVNESTINEDNLQKIKNHLNMAKITEKDKVLPFCHWLSGFIDSCDSNELNEVQTTKVKNKLNNLFDHVVKDYSPTLKVGNNSKKKESGNEGKLEAMC